jgi:hypothetical protein
VWVDAGCNAGPEGDEKDGKQASGGREESQAEEPMELVKRMSGRCDRVRESARANLCEMTPGLEHEG